ncbi:hypothetical protein EXIGLDRAFT_641039 [Exidia glandulosa HHB12029]|uniref:Phosphatidylglycerol/phosphatidylinositol transfer protein n=1 Tax=Exidia glandulosa HHB12029 TaxID=1314781 RepID=A0A165MCF8_EXIGL|nr:hypothetical protein EXIGLDRAFT_641039 [Exidia glandulosa HHB12029]
MFLRLALAALAVLPLAARAAAVGQTVVALGSFSDKVQVIDCGAPEDAVQIQSIEISPDPPKAGENVTIIATGLVQQQLNPGAYADVTVKVGLIKLLQKRFDICEEAETANATVQCPVDPDTYTIVQTVELPKEVPPAKFVINVRGYTDAEDPMVCLDLKLDFLPSKPKFISW